MKSSVELIAHQSSVVYSPEFSVNTPQESSPRRAFTGPTKPDVEYDMQTPDFWKQFRAADETQVPNDK